MADFLEQPMMVYDVKTLLRSTQRRPVRTAGFRALKPLTMLVERGSKAETVEWRGLKPCCEGDMVREALRVGSSIRSKTLISGHSKLIGRYDGPWSGDFPGFNTGMTLADFQIAGISAAFTDKLKRWVA